MLFYYLFMASYLSMQYKILAFVCLILCIAIHPINAKEWVVTPEDDLQSLLDNSQDGDVLKLLAGTYQGNFVINHQVSLIGEAGAVIDANGEGHAIFIENSNVTIANLKIINWGNDLTEENSGIYSKRKTENITIRDNDLSGDGFGILINKVSHSKVIGNKVQGNTKLRSADRGNGIQIASVEHSHVYNNETFNVRDGIYVIASKNNIIEGNTMHDLRYGIHYMYSYDNSVIDNTAYRTRAGYALMSSRRLTITGNKTNNSEDYGFLLNYITQSTFEGNIIKDVWTKPENKVLGRDGKGLFVYNSGYNTIKNNYIDTTEIGIHLTAGSEQTKVYGNSFINNPVQVKYVSNKKQEWSFEGKGNYWSNYLGWDMNGDSIGDVAFEPNDGIDQLIWQYPEMKMIMDSPVVLILRWVQKEFPVLKPPGVKDSFPLMSSPITPPEVQVLVNSSTEGTTSHAKKVKSTQ